MLLTFVSRTFGLRYDVMSEECLSLVSSNDCPSRRIYTALVRCTYLYAIASQAQGAHASNVPAQVTNRRAKGDPIVMSDFVSVNCKCGSVSCDVLRAAVT